MLDLLINNPILTLFIIMAVGYFIGQIKIGTFSLGVAGSLFAGIIVSALSPELALPSFIYMFGLILFIYTTGISLGPSYFASLRNTGLRDNLLAVGVVALGAVLVVAAAILFNIDGIMATGLYTGTFTVTPALAGVLDALPDNSAIPVVGYSLAYPFSILASLLIIGLLRKAWKIDKKEASTIDTSINPHTVHYLRPEPVSVKDVAAKSSANITVSRISSGGEIGLVTEDTIIKQGDYVTIVGTPKDYKVAVAWMGKQSTRIHLEANRNDLLLRIKTNESALSGHFLRAS